MKYTEELVGAIIKGIENGLTLKSILEILNISKTTFYRWKELKSDFSNLIKKAELDSINKNLELIQKAGEGYKVNVLNKKGELVEIDVPGDWRALGWKLERGHQGIFSIKQNINLSGKLDIDVIKPEKPKGKK